MFNPASTTTGTGQSSTGNGTGTLSSPPPPGSDPFKSLGGGSPWCGSASLGAQAQENCRISGTIAAPHPVQDYGIDFPQFSLSHIADIFEYAIGGLLYILWGAWTWIVHVLLALLQWAFSLDLLNRAMSSVTSALNTLHNNLFGNSWMLAALAVLGLWGIWNGLVRRKTIETLGGLATAVALMIVALVLIAAPNATVGQFSRDMDNASLATLGLASRGSVDLSHPQTKFAQTEGNLYSDFVLRPWCALEFANVSYCTSKRSYTFKKQDGTTGHGTTTIADIWLTFPPNSVEREGLYNQTVAGSLQPSTGELTHIANGFIDVFDFFGGDISTQGAPNTMQQCHRDYPSGSQCTVLANAPSVIKQNKNAVAIQTFGDTFTRFALFIFISIGLLGVAFVLGYLTLKLLMASIKALLLTLAAPVILFLPAFGESGRITFGAWAKRLFGAIVSKFVFAVMLALVLLVAGIINSLPFSWVSVWMLNIIFWWGVFFERKTFVGFLSADRRTTERSGLDVAGQAGQFRLASTLASLYFGGRVARSVTGMATKLPRAATGFATRQVRSRVADRKTARSEAVREERRRGIDDDAERGIRAADRDKVRSAEVVLAGHRNDRAERDRLRGEVRALETEERENQNRADRAKSLTTAREHYIANRDRARAELKTKQAELAKAEQKVQDDQAAVRDAQNTMLRLESGDRVIDQRERDAWTAQTRRDLAADEFPTIAADPASFERSLNRVGITRHEYDTANAQQRAEYDQRARREWQEARQRLQAGDYDEQRAAAGLPMQRRERTEAWKTAKPETRSDAKNRYEVLRERGPNNRNHGGRQRSRRGVR